MCTSKTPKILDKLHELSAIGFDLVRWDISNCAGLFDSVDVSCTLVDAANREHKFSVTVPYGAVVDITEQDKIMYYHKVVDILIDSSYWSENFPELEDSLYEEVHREVKELIRTCQDRSEAI